MKTILIKTFVIVGLLLITVQVALANILKETVKIVVSAPAVVVREGARIVEDNTGGDVSKVAGNTRKEANRAVDNTKIAVDGASSAIKDLDKKPLKAVTRLSACAATICASEVVAHKRAQKLRAKKEQEYQAAVKKAETENVKSLKGILTNRVSQLKEDKAVYEASRKTLETAILLSLSIQKHQTSPPEIPAKFQSLSTEKNKALVKTYFESLHRQLADLNSDTLSEHRKIEIQILEAAKASGEDYNTFLNAVVAGMSKDRKYAMSLAATNAELMPELDALLLSIEEQLAKIEAEIVTTEAKIKALG